MRIIDLEILNFRGIKESHITFPSDSRIVCLIGAGDSTKSTLLKAIEWLFWPTWSLMINDADFYHSDPTKPIVISIDCNDSVQIIHPNAFSVYSLSDEFRNYKSVLYLTKWEQQQGRFCLQYPGIFQYDEKQDSKELFEHASILSSQSGAGLMQAVIDFEKICATNVMSELKSYYDRLAKNSYSFAKITKKVTFGQLLLELQKSDRYEIILRILKWFETDTSFKCFRKELHSEMIRSVYYAKEHSISILDAAMRIRRDPTLQKRYQSFKFLSSRTLLSKGLEFDCVIIDMSTPLTAKEFYVAMTRAMKKIYILSSSNMLTLMP